MIEALIIPLGLILFGGAVVMLGMMFVLGAQLSEEESLREIERKSFKPKYTTEEFWAMLREAGDGKAKG